jgi:two-component system alkaline phosphatase synthesis response regulator PhoP
MASILCVDGDQYLTDLMQYALGREGFDVILAHSGKEALRLLHTDSPDLLTMDVNLPDTNGYRVLSSLRTFSQVPVLILSARAQDEDIIAGLQQGADDYMTKPFSMQVLVNRIKAILRRTTVQAEPDGGRPYRLPGAVFSPSGHEIVGPSVRIKLTPTESRILHLLVQHEGQVLSPDRIMERIWGYDCESDANVIKTHMHRLRQKIASLPGNPQPIQTLPGIGYVVGAEDARSRVAQVAAS